MKTPCRAWVNQPSGLQECHKLHGMLVIAVAPYGPNSLTVYPISGDIVSMVVPENVLSEGWPKHLRSDKHEPTS